MGSGKGDDGSGQGEEEDEQGEEEDKEVKELLLLRDIQIRQDPYNC